MKSIDYFSKTFGKHTTLVSDCDYDDIVSTGKWCVVCKRGHYYLQKRFNMTSGIIEMHRYIMKPKKGMYTDHINGDTMDNRRKNLRICTNAANLRNGRLRSNNTSGVTGVQFIKERGNWAARIRVNYKTISLGRFDNFEDAVSARKIAELKYWDV